MAWPHVSPRLMWNNGVLSKYVEPDLPPTTIDYIHRSRARETQLSTLLQRRCLLLGRRRRRRWNDSLMCARQYRSRAIRVHLPPLRNSPGSAETAASSSVQSTTKIADLSSKSHYKLVFYMIKMTNFPLLSQSDGSMLAASTMVDAGVELKEKCYPRAAL